MGRMEADDSRDLVREGAEGRRNLGGALGADDRLVSTGDLSEYLGIPVQTIYQWRHRGEGPRGYRIGRHVRYRWADVQAWLATRSDDVERPFHPAG